MLDIRNPLSSQAKSLGKLLTTARGGAQGSDLKSKGRGGNTAQNPHTSLTLEECLLMKDYNARPLNYQCNLQRLSMVFWRALQIKFYNKDKEI